MGKRGQEFIGRLQAGVAIGDGAMGTYLHEQGCDLRRGAEMLNVLQPDIVRRVHAAYVEAGAELIETNTFAANAPRLDARHMADRLRDINLAGVRLAREAAEGRAWVAGSVGPIDLTPLSDNWNETAAREIYAAQIGLLIEGGVDAIQLETFPDLRLLLVALAEAVRLCGRETPVIAQVVLGDGGRLSSGETGEEAARQLAAAGAAVVGVNCGRGVRAILEAVGGVLAGAGSTPVSAYPNAGYPELLDGRLVYMATPQYLGQQAAQLVRRGVRLIGGCCGTTPETIRAMRLAVAGIRRGPRLASASPPPAPIQATAGTAEYPRGGFLEGLRPKLPIIAEIDPPAHLDYSAVIAGAKALAQQGVDAISLADNPLASIRICNLVVGAAVKREAGVQAVCHVTCRDRNSLGLQSALMGAHATGIEAILAVTGDPTHGDPHGRAVSVYEMDSVGLVRLAAGLNRGLTTTGRDIRGKTNFSIGVAFNSAAPNLAAEVRRLKRKVDEGARFVLTQPVFDRDHARRVLDAARLPGLRVFLGFLPLVSAKMAQYLHNEVPGITIPAPILDQLGSLASLEDQERFGVAQARELIVSLVPELQGIYLISPANRWKLLLPLVEALR